MISAKHANSCMVCLPTFIWLNFIVNVGKCNSHGSYLGFDDCAGLSNSIGTLPASPLSSTLFNRFLACRTVEQLKLFWWMDILTAAMNSECKSSNQQVTGNLSPSLFALKFESNERNFPHILTDFDDLDPPAVVKCGSFGSWFFLLVLGEAALQRVRSSG